MDLKKLALGLVTDVAEAAATGVLKAWDPLGMMLVKDATAVDAQDMQVRGFERMLRASAALAGSALAQTATLSPSGAGGGLSGVPDGFEPATAEETALMAEKYGLDPSQMQVLKPKAQKDADGEDVVQTVNGPIKRSKIPLGPDGQPDAKWVDDNCACPEHVEKRRQKQATADGKGMNGGYI